MIASPIWLPVTLVAGAVQAWRTAVQRRVGRSLSVNGAGLVRYLYGLPFALVMLAGYHALAAPGVWPALGAQFWPFCLAGAIGQIVATNLLLMAFGERNFVVGTAYSKTEAVQAALFSAVLLHDHLSALSWAGIALGVVGVMVLATGGRAMAPVAFARALGERAALYGIASGTVFALATIAIRRTTFEVATGDHILAALVTLTATVATQTMLQGGYVLLRERGEMARVLASWRVSGQVGLLSSVGSACWFTGFATAPVALVRIVGQVEVAFTMAFAHFYLGERMARSEVAGLLIVATGVVLALAGAL
ncbi:EamA family transporter [Sphingomonas sp. NFR15]|uniref:EamA family transporter n=1 Tax=Sphingomonas sp. NFR15 TaxID=1566282 RepID=UPI0008875258|nr:EamA family transporter [Sphingomonas sp. NFR15]SDA17387.1 EamA-like transporter family protein [Sphingomonas sp. NFR15]